MSTRATMMIRSLRPADHHCCPSVDRTLLHSNNDPGPGDLRMHKVIILLWRRGTCELKLQRGYFLTLPISKWQPTYSTVLLYQFLKHSLVGGASKFEILSSARILSLAESLHQQFFPSKKCTFRLSCKETSILSYKILYLWGYILYCTITYLECNPSFCKFSSMIDSLLPSVPVLSGFIKHTLLPLKRPILFAYLTTSQLTRSAPAQLQTSWEQCISWDNHLIHTITSWFQRFPEI